MNAIILLAASGILTLFAGIFNLKKLLLPLVILCLGIALGLTLMDWNQNLAPFFNDMLRIDNYSIAFSVVMIAVALLVFLLSGFYYRQEVEHRADIYGLILFSLVGALILASYSNMVMLFLGIEILSIPLYVLAASNRKNLSSNEAGLKYFLMGSFASGFMLFGIALIYGATGSLHLEAISAANGSFQGPAYPLLGTGYLLVLAGFLFKVSAAPFHFWAPDVYQGSPSIITLFMSTVVKVAAFAALFRFVVTAIPVELFPGKIQNTLWVISLITMLVGNITAVYQKSLKRMLAYSGISNAGYMLIAVVLAPQPIANSALLLYGIAYSFASVLAFSVFILVKQHSGNEEIEGFRGLVKENPLLAGVLSLAMLSMAGIPPLGGFFAKYFLFATAMQEGYLILTIAAVIASLIGVFYYLRVIAVSYSQSTTSLEKIEIPAIYYLVFLVCVAGLIATGILPGHITSLL